MANFSDLPTEIWLLIARRLNIACLARLKSLNSFFFNCYMDKRWERVEIDNIDTSFAAKVVHDLERMVYDLRIFSSIFADNVVVTPS